MVVDVFTFNGEYELLEIHLSILDAYVGQFIICEATETFSGLAKPLYYEKEKERFKKWHHKIKYFIITPPYQEGIMAMANASPLVTKESHNWHREFCQKETIKEALGHLDDEDTVFIGDVDEIWDPHLNVSAPQKLRLLVYTYYLNNRSSEVFWGTLVAPYWFIKDSSLNYIRNLEDLKGTAYGGWHFTSMGGYEEVKRKLRDSYTTDNYNHPNIQANLITAHGLVDFLGRDFMYSHDEDGWPGYLKENKEKYLHLCR